MALPKALAAPLLFLLSACLSLAAGLPPAPSPYVMDAIVSRQGDVWIATEGKGLWRLPAGGAAWQREQAPQELAGTSNYYALAEDGSGRIWAGTDNCGFLVHDGKQWARFAREEGMPGERVFSIDASSSAVAVATNGGIAVFGKDGWQVWGRGEGLPDDAAAALAFDAHGRLWAAFSCGGAGVLQHSGKWQLWQAPWYEPGTTARQPFTATGKGLPGNLANALAVDGDVAYYGCTSGLAAKAGNANWSYWRGRDCKEKNARLYQCPLPPGLTDAQQQGCLAEDYVTALLPDGEFLWVGYREKGVQKLRKKDMQPVGDPAVSAFNSAKDARSLWVRRLLKLPNGDLLAATNGGGLRHVAKLAPSAPPALAPLPAPAPAVFTEADLGELHHRLVSGHGEAPRAFFWYDDWRTRGSTRGNWCQRYGTHSAMLCAAASPQNVYLQFSQSNAPGTSISGAMGPHHKKGDALRHWVQAYNDADNPNVLWNPDAGTRTEAEWDDHGEEYPAAMDGPDVWAKVVVPEGSWLLSLYFYNPNGHTRRNGYRDFLVELRCQPGDPGPDDAALPENALSLPVLERTRVYDFAGSGCWKHFILSRPGAYLVRVCRNGSLNAILNGVFLSNRLRSESEERFFRDLAIPEGRKNFQFISAGMVPPNALRLWGSAFFPEKNAGFRLARRCSLVSWYAMQVNASVPRVLTERLRSLLPLWTPKDEADYVKELQVAWRRVQFNYPHARSSFWRPYSPGVVPLTLEELRFAQSQNIDWHEYAPGAAKPPSVPLEELRRMMKNPPSPPPPVDDDILVDDDSDGDIFADDSSDL